MLLPISVSLSDIKVTWGGDDLASVSSVEFAWAGAVKRTDKTSNPVRNTDIFLPDMNILKRTRIIILPQSVY